MNVKEKVKSIILRNPIQKYIKNKKRKKLQNTDFTLLTPDCTGGIIYHNLGLKFLSPTINLMMLQKDFLQFVLHLDDYLEGTFHFFKHETYACPCAKLVPQNNKKEITIHFTHYHSEEESIIKWNERKGRINKNNLFIVIEQRDGITKEDLLQLGEIKATGIVAFTYEDYPDIPYAVYLPKYKDCGEVGNLLLQNHLSGQREFDNYFDYVKWFNQAEGFPYDVKSFIK
jgi:uncharacterized protein (DUF1919 family)